MSRYGAWRARPRVTAAVVLALGWALMLAYAWPGIMTNDCYDHLREGRAGFYTDSHPPILALLWRYLDTLVTGPAGMYLLQTGLFVGGLYAFFIRSFAPVRAAAVAIAVALFPPVLAPMAVVWKDAVMASGLVVGLAALLAERRSVRVAGLAALWLASAVRYNAAAATLPLIVLLFTWSEVRPGWRGWVTRYGLATAVWIAVTASSMGVNSALTDRRMHFWASSNAVHDIVGTLAKVDHAIPDAELRVRLAGTQLRIDHDIHATMRALYKSSDYTHHVIGDRRLWDLPIMGQTPAPAAQRDAMARAWRDIVTSYPGAYLAHRLDVFRMVLGLAKKNPGVMVQVGRGQNRLFAIPMGLEHRPYVAQDVVQRMLERLARNTPLFRGALYLVLALVLGVLARRHRDLLAILASGLGLELSLLPFAATPDYRYSHWLVVCTVLVAVVLVTRHRRARALRS